MAGPGLGTNYEREVGGVGAEHFVQAPKVTFVHLALLTASSSKLETLLTTALAGKGSKGEDIDLGRVMALRFKGKLSDGTTDRYALRFSTDNGGGGVFSTYIGGADAEIPATEAQFDLWVRTMTGDQTVTVEVYYI